MKLAKRYHPDVHHDPALADLRDKLEGIFFALNDAYQAMSSPKPPEPPAPPTANSVAAQAEVAVDDGERAAHAEQTQAVQEAIGCLPPKQRTAIVLRYYEGLAGREIAAAMETSVKAVERLLARARATLEGLLINYLKK